MSILTVTVKSTDEKMGYRGFVRDQPPLDIDYIPPFGNDKGATPLELMLVALSVCTSSGVGVVSSGDCLLIPGVNGHVSPD